MLRCVFGRLRRSQPKPTPSRAHWLNAPAEEMAPVQVAAGPGEVAAGKPSARVAVVTAVPGVDAKEARASPVEGPEIAGREVAAADPEGHRVPEV